MAHVWHITYDGALPSSAVVGEILAEANDLEQRHAGLRQGSVHVSQPDRLGDRGTLRLALRLHARSFLVTRIVPARADEPIRHVVREAFAAAARLLGDPQERSRLRRAA